MNQNRSDDNKTSDNDIPIWKQILIGIVAVFCLVEGRKAFNFITDYNHSTSIGEGSAKVTLIKNDVTNIDGARKEIANSTYQWEDRTGNRSGVPTSVHKMTFNGDITTCSASSRLITQDNWGAVEQGRASLVEGRFADTGEKYVRALCSEIGYAIVVQNGALKIFYGRTGNDTWLASKQ